MRHPPTTVERAFELANDIEKQLQVTENFFRKFDLAMKLKRDELKKTNEEAANR